MLYFAKWKVALIAAVLIIGAAAALPNVVAEEARFGPDGQPKGLWSWPVVPHNEINLGLDLQGGSYLLLQVDMAEVIEERLIGLRDDVRTALSEAGIAAGTPAVVDGEVSVRVRELADRPAAIDALEGLIEPIQSATGFGAGRTVAIDGAEGTEIRARLTPEFVDELRRRTVRQSIEVVRRRIDGMGVSEPIIQRQGQSRIIVQAPGVDDPERLKAQIGKTARMTFHMVASDNPRDIEVALGGRLSPLQSLFPTERAEEPHLLVRKRATLSGDDLRTATLGFDARDSQPAVDFRFDGAAARIFCRLTSENVGRRFAIVLDEVIITAPVIITSICQGQGQITGNFTTETAGDLAALLRAGALPAPLTIVEERTVGAELGADSVAAGRIALIIGFIGVVLFMLAAYGTFGVFANVALACNIILIAGALSLLQATLTLPGIAGVILTIGMAVDANVLIFERIREEMRAGRTPANAIEAGYTRAFSAILDANVTTFLAALLLYIFGSGPVRGFAVTLSIGILTSVFTAFVLSRWLAAMWFARVRPRALPI